MPLQPTTPENKSVPSTVSKDVTHFHITNLNIKVDPNDAAATTASVVWQEGYMDGETFVPTESNSALLSGSALLDKVAGITDGTSSIYDNVKEAVWALLQDESLVAAGSVT